MHVRAGPEEYQSAEYDVDVISLESSVDGVCNGDLPGDYWLSFISMLSDKKRRQEIREEREFVVGMLQKRDPKIIGNGPDDFLSRHA